MVILDTNAVDHPGHHEVHDQRVADWQKPHEDNDCRDKATSEHVFVSYRVYDCHVNLDSKSCQNVRRSQWRRVIGEVGYPQYT